MDWTADFTVLEHRTIRRKNPMNESEQCTKRHNEIRKAESYRKACIADGCTDYHLKGMDDRIEAFRQFAEEHPDRMKQPGITRGQ
jgi:hypothetical protein